MFKRILVPLDGSELAESVLPAVVALAKSMGADIALLRIIAVPTLMNSYATHDRLTAPVDEAQVAAYSLWFAAMDYLHDVREKLKPEGIQVSTEIRSGSVVETIVSYAQSTRADLIAMFTPRRRSAERFDIGEITGQVARTSSIPVLILNRETK